MSWKLMPGKLLLKLLVLAAWLGACYALRYQLMEDPRWLDICDGKTGNVWCAVRGNFGLIIHWQLLAWLALLLSVPAFFIAGPRGRGLAWLSLLFALPALALYTVTLAVFALLIAALRIVRLERHSENVSAMATSVQPSA